MKPTKQQLFLLHLLHNQYCKTIMPISGKGGLKQFLYFSYSYDNKKDTLSPQENPNQNNDNFKGMQVFKNLVKRGYVVADKVLLGVQYYKLSELGLSFIKDNKDNGN